MFFRLAIATALAVLFVAAPALTQLVAAQQTASTAYDKSQDTRLDELAKQLAALTTRVTTTEGKVTDIDRRIATLTDDLQMLTNATKDIDARLKKLGEDVSTIADKPSTELTAMKTQLDAISLKDGESYVPNISGAMSSDKFRQEMQTVVNKSLKPSGSILLTNKTAIPQWVYINRTEYYLRPGEQLPLGVNVGTVTTQLPGEEMQTWTIAPPAYQMALEIVPKPIPTPSGAPIGYPGTPSYLNPPVAAPITLGAAPYLGITEVAYR
jgi:TolA-binding protein